MTSLYVLFEDATGLGLFERLEGDDVATQSVQSSYTDLARFSKLVSLKAFAPFTSAETALHSINAISEGITCEFLTNFLEQNLPKSSKSKKGAFTLGIQDAKLAQSVSEEFGCSCDSSARVTELSRGIRLHFRRFVNGLEEGDREKSQLGLSHSYSRSKVKFNVNRVDNMVIQSIAMLDQLDKDLNTFAMRCKEWYGWHFPELRKYATDNEMFARLCVAIGDKKTMSEAKLPEIEAIVGSEELAETILHACRASMGMDVSAEDLVLIDSFAHKVISLGEYRKSLYGYLRSKMGGIAPNLTAVIGEVIGARLISHAGSLTSLAKYPASTVQILGAEKALFRALKKKTNTPKYGLLFNSSFIGRAGAKNKGRIARYLANKCSIASRIDCFGEMETEVFGLKLRQQVEDRLKFYETGDIPKKNVDAMAEAMIDFKSEQSELASKRVRSRSSSPAKSAKKAKVAEDTTAMAVDEAPDSAEAKAAKKAAKKAKKEAKAAKKAAKAAKKAAKK